MASPSPLLSGLHRPLIKSSFLPPFQIRKTSNPSSNPSFKLPPISTAVSSSSSSSSSDREELRWLREEQRWIREEKRWLREESRWRSEREGLIREIAALRVKIDTLERGKGGLGVDEVPIGRLADVEARPVLVEEAEVKEMVFEEVRVLEVEKENREGEWRTLRKGSEGEEVRAMQEALSKLGFYSGEEDMEYSSFSSGTERAVKTWQASLGTLEDGIMTSELLKRLFTGRSSEEYKYPGGGSVSGAGMGGTNGAPTASVSEITEIKQTVIKESDDAEFEVSEHRVFLLGENRWEEPSSLKDRDKPTIGSKVVSPTKCLTCRGEGRLMCTECDGTGEPNIEEQFMEWVEEGARCPYCEGLGYTTCNVCGGNTVASLI